MSNVLTEKFIRLKTAVGGNREVTAYEDTFGMTKEEQAHITRPNQWNTRILSELEFALNLREDGAFDEAIGRALDLLLKAMEEEGGLSNAVCHKAEGLARGREIGPDLFQTVAEAAAGEVNPRTSWRASKEFRLQLVRELSRRALKQAIIHAGGAVEC